MLNIDADSTPAKIGARDRRLPLSVSSAYTKATLRDLAKFEGRTLDPSIVRRAELAHDPAVRDGGDPAVKADLTAPPRAQLESASPPPAPSAFSFTPLRDLLAEQPQPEKWLWDGILSEGGLSLLAGKPKAGKSVLVRNLAMCIARGIPFCNRPTRKGRVVYLAFEESRNAIRRHFELMNADGSEEIVIHVGPKFGSDADDPGRLLLNIVSTYRPALIAIDTFAKLFRIRDINKDYTAVSKALEIPMHIGREGKTHILLTHHAGKGENTEPIDQIIGTTALAGAVDTILILDRSRNLGGDASVLTSIQRYGDEPDPLSLILDERTEIFAPNATDAAQTRTREDAKIAEIAAFIRGHANRATETEIRQSISGRVETIRRLLRQAVATGRILTSGGAKKGDPTLYRLPDTSQPETREQNREK